jgi:transposase InsO family protein
MREHDLQPKRRRGFVATTDSDHDGPIVPDLARDRIVDGPNQLWVADIRYIAIQRASSIWRRFLMPGRAAWSATRLAARSMRGLPLPR